jgi:uncharacterized cupin superfamily protein
VANVFEPEFDAEQDRPDFAWRRSRIGWQAGSVKLGASVFELAPGRAPFPYHFHLANEELLVVLSGRPDLRTPEGWRTLEEGEVVSFPVGQRGAHQVLNRSDVRVRILIVSEMRAPDVVHYPDSGKVGAREQAPGSKAGGPNLTFRREDAVDYFDGEPRPE